MRPRTFEFDVTDGNGAYVCLEAMPNKPGKPKSKRTPVRLRHKIEKASVAKQRKQRKLAKNNPEWRSRLKKDPGIPNLFPYKDRILHEIEEKKRLKEEEYLRKREEAKATKAVKSADADLPDVGDVRSDEECLGEDQMAEDAPLADSHPMSALLASAKARAAEYDDVSDNEEDGMDEDASEGDVEIESSTTFTTSGPKTQESSRRAFDKIFQNVLSSADILLYVLDARDPNGTRSREIERQIMAVDAGSKRLILILNKIDLVPPSIVKSWLTYLRRSFPTLPLRANTPAPNARTFDHKSFTVKATSETLLHTLKSYAQSKNLKRTITVGVVGYPNVGKSSVINALTSRLSRSRSSASTACPVGAEAGVTTSLREVKLDNKLKLLDCPGIVFPSSSDPTNTHPSSSKPSTSEAHLILLSALPPKQISDPIPAVTLLLNRLSSTRSGLQNLLNTYNVPALMPNANGDSTTDFLVQVARKRGRLGKGGVPNLWGAAMTVVTDWRDGRVQGWTDAPVDVEGERGEKEVVNQWAKEFKLEGLWGDGSAEEVSNEVMEE